MPLGAPPARDRRPVRKPRLREDVVNVVLYGRHRHEQRARDLLIRESSGDCGSDLALPGREHRRPVVHRGRHDDYDPPVSRRDLNLEVRRDRRERRRDAMAMFGSRVDEVDRRRDDLVDDLIRSH